MGAAFAPAMLDFSWDYGKKDTSTVHFLDFHEYINSINDNVGLSLEYNQSEIMFLDLSKYHNGNIHTSIYRKSSDCDTILRADSFHPSSLITNIPLGQFQRLRGICDCDDEFDQQAINIYQRLKQRGYNT